MEIMMGRIIGACIKKTIVFAAFLMSMAFLACLGTVVVEGVKSEMEIVQVK